jgi:hypothetical protein
MLRSSHTVDLDDREMSKVFLLQLPYPNPSFPTLLHLINITEIFHRPDDASLGRRSAFIRLCGLLSTWYRRIGGTHRALTQKWGDLFDHYSDMPTPADIVEKKSLHDAQMWKKKRHSSATSNFAIAHPFFFHWLRDVNRRCSNLLPTTNDSSVHRMWFVRTRVNIWPPA